MRRVNWRHGLIQRINEIMGDDSGTETAVSGTVPGITEWSVQAAMLSNVRRVVQALAGYSNQGRPMTGLALSTIGNNKIAISPGIGFTKAGNVIVLAVSINKIVSTANGTYYVFLQHFMSELNGVDNPAGKYTAFVGTTNYENIVYDDLITALGNIAGSVQNDVIITQTSTVAPNDDAIYIGSYTADGATVSSATDNPVRGFEEFVDPINKIIQGKLQIGGLLKVTGTSAFTGQGWFLGDLIIDGDITVQNSGGHGVPGLTQDITLAGVTVLTFSRGLLTAVT